MDPNKNMNGPKEKEISTVCYDYDKNNIARRLYISESHFELTK